MKKEEKAPQTAVEWLVDQLEKHYVKVDIKNTAVFYQAKEMEKQQIIETWHNGYENQSPMIDEKNLEENNTTTKHLRNRTMKKEEQKQHLIDMMRDDENLGLYENWVEDAEKESSLSDLNSKANIFWSGYRVGVKSKERMLAFINDEDNHTEGELGNSCIDVQTLVNFIEQFKKK
jgi:hypothetical protein